MSEYTEEIYAQINKIEDEINSIYQKKYDSLKERNENIELEPDDDDTFFVIYRHSKGVSEVCVRCIGTDGILVEDDCGELLTIDFFDLDIEDKVAILSVM